VTTTAGNEGDTGSESARRNALAANWYTIARAVWNMHDALLTEQRRTNQLLEALVVASGGTVPRPVPPGGLVAVDAAERIQQLLDDRGFGGPGAANALGSILLRDADGVARLGAEGDEGVIAVAEGSAALWWADGRDAEALDLRTVATARRSDRLVTLELPTGRSISVLAGSVDFAQGWMTRLKRLGVSHR
jgi:hypothetical protein